MEKKARALAKIVQGARPHGEEIVISFPRRHHAGDRLLIGDGFLFGERKERGMNAACFEGSEKRLCKTARNGVRNEQHALLLHAPFKDGERPVYGALRIDMKPCRKCRNIHTITSYEVWLDASAH